MGEIECMICKEKDQSKLELHHKLPKFMGGTDADGRVYLCKKHHGILHSLVMKKLWGKLRLEDRIYLRSYIMGYTEWFLKNWKD